MLRGLLGTRATVVSDINLILQITVLFVLLAVTVRARKRGLSAQRALLAVAVMLNAVLIIAIMNPSFFRIFPFAVRNPGAPVPRLLWPHVLLGIVAELAGVYLIASKELDSDSPMGLGPFRWTPRRVLGVMLFLWTLALMVGLVIYSRLYM
jgi:hypothetical protein